MGRKSKLHFSSHIKYLNKIKKIFGFLKKLNCKKNNCDEFRDYSNKKMCSSDFILNISFLSGFLLLILLNSISITAHCFYFLNITIKPYQFIISIILSLIIWILIMGKRFRNNLKLFIISFLLVTVGICTCYEISKYYFDVSYDGLSYHQEAIIQIKEGFNPIKEKIVPDVWDMTWAIWINHFPKNAWITAALFASFEDNIEAGKAAGILLILSSTLISFATLKALNCGIIFCSITAIISNFTPIFICQFATYYLDFQIGSMILLIACFLANLGTKNVLSKFSCLGLIFTILLMFGIKFTAPMYGFVLIAGSLWIFFIKKMWVETKTVLFSCIAGLILGVITTGYSSYFLNFINEKDPFYPMHKKIYIPAIKKVWDWDYVMFANRPNELKNFNRMEKLIISIVAESNSGLGKETERSFSPYSEVIDKNEKNERNWQIIADHVKFPIRLMESEFNKFKIPDLRIGGFGPLFFLSCIIAIVVLVLLAVLNIKYFFIAFSSTVAIIVSALLNSECWWARYVPQLWLIPIFLATMAYLNNNYFYKINVKTLAWLIVFIMAINITKIGIVQIKYQGESSEYIKNILAQEGKSNKVQVYDFSIFRALRERYRKHGVRFVEKTIESGVFENHLLKSVKDVNKNIIKESYAKTNDYTYVLFINNPNLDLEKLAIAIDEWYLKPKFITEKIIN